MTGGRVDPPAARRIRALRSQIAPSPPPRRGGMGWGGRGAAASEGASASSATAGAGGLDAAQRAHFAEHGFIVADDIISASQLERLQAAARRVRDRVRSGALTHGYLQRSPGEPAVDEADWEIWCIRGLYSAQHAEPVFAELYGSDPVLDYVTSFLECEREELILGDTALMIEPRDADFTSGWHRDFVLGSDPDSEAAEWRECPDWAASSRTPAARRALQFQIALLETQVLEFVPRSHTRLPNDEERALLLQRENKSNPGVAMPGGAPAPLKPGEVLFFDGGLLHNGNVVWDDERLTLHCYASALRPDGGADKWAGRQQWWMTHPTVHDALPTPLLRRMWRNFTEVSAGHLPPAIAARNADASSLAQHDDALAQEFGDGEWMPAHHAKYPTLEERLRGGLTRNPAFRAEAAAAAAAVAARGGGGG